RSEASTERSRRWREAPTSLGPSPSRSPVLVDSTTRSRRPLMAAPSTVSDAPSEYTSALSKKLTPASSAMSSRRRASSAPVSPQAENSGPLPPKVPTPKPSADTLRPDAPRERYCMIGFPCRGRNRAASAQAGSGPCAPGSPRSAIHFPGLHCPEKPTRWRRTVNGILIIMDRVGDIALFLQVLDLGSISAAARHLDLSVAVASQRLKRLERELGVRPLHPTTRRLPPTPAGLALAPEARALVEELALLGDRLRQGGGEVGGTLRVTASASFGRQY